MANTYKYVDENIEYSGLKNPQIRTGQKIAASSYVVDEDGNIISNKPVVNAIDIDWNNATTEGLENPIKTSGDVLKEIVKTKNAVSNIHIPTSIYELAGGTQVLTTENFETIKEQLTGKSAFQIAKETAEAAGIAFPYTTEVSWIASLKGDKGNPGESGSDGLSAYQIAKLYNSNIGTEAEWIASLQGQSAFQIAARTYAMLDKEFPYSNETEWMEAIINNNVDVEQLVINFESLVNRINSIFGNDNNASINDIIALELAKQLIPENARESLDTLKEISAWIQEHPEDAAAMNLSISNLENSLGNLLTEWDGSKDTFVQKGNIYESDGHGGQKLKTMSSGRDYAETLEQVNILIGQLSFAQNVEDNAEQNIIVDISSEEQGVKIKGNTVKFNVNNELYDNIKLIAANYESSNRTITLGLNTDALETILNETIDTSVSKANAYTNEKLTCKII